LNHQNHLKRKLSCGRPWGYNIHGSCPLRGRGMRSQELGQCDMRGDRRKVLCSMGNTFGGIVFWILELMLTLRSPFKNEDCL